MEQNQLQTFQFHIWTIYLFIFHYSQDLPWVDDVIITGVHLKDNDDFKIDATVWHVIADKRDPVFLPWWCGFSEVVHSQIPVSLLEDSSGD